MLRQLPAVPGTFPVAGTLENRCSRNGVVVIRGFIGSGGLFVFVFVARLAFESVGEINTGSSCSDEAEDGMIHVEEQVGSFRCHNFLLYSIVCLAKTFWELHGRCVTILSLFVKFLANLLFNFVL